MHQGLMGRSAGILLFAMTLVLLASSPLIYAATDSVVGATDGISSNYSAETGRQLPALGNTPQSDKEMSIEVSDQFVWQPSDRSLNGAGRGSVWEQIIRSNRIPIHLTPDVERFMAEMEEDAWWVEKILERSRPYLHFIVSRLDARGLPLDLALIPVIESAYQPHVLSSGDAAGLWQIVPITAVQIGLKRTAWFDGRADLRQSTRAALDYLSYLNAEFSGDWALTLAAYNAGPGRVKSAIEKNSKKGKDTDFWSLDLPQETQNYVPKLAALIELLRQTPASPLKMPYIKNEEYFSEVDAGRRISLDVAAELAELSEEKIQLLNSGFIHAVTPPKGPHTLLLPRQQVAAFNKNLEKARDRVLYSLPKTHVVKSGDNIGAIAKLYGITRKELRELNELPDDLIRIGQKLAVVDRRTPDQDPAPEAVASVTTKKTRDQVTDAVPTAHPGTHIVKSGDNISTIAKLYGITRKELRELNNLTGDLIRIGQKLAVVDRRNSGHNSTTGIVATTATTATTKTRDQLADSRPKTHVVKSGDNIGAIARRYGITRKALRELNDLPSDLIRIGQKLAVADQHAVGRDSAASQNTNKGSDGDVVAAKKKVTTKAVTYVIRAGDTLSQIARRFNVKAGSITLQDGSSPSEKRLIPGQSLLIGQPGQKNSS